MDPKTRAISLKRILNKLNKLEKMVKEYKIQNDKEHAELKGLIDGINNRGKAKES